MIGIDAIRRIADEVMSLHASGCKALADGDIVWAQLKFSVANVKLRNLQRLLDGEPESPPPPKPMRKLCVVGSELPSWMNKTHGGDDGNGAA